MDALGLCAGRRVLALVPACPCVASLAVAPCYAPLCRRAAFETGRLLQLLRCRSRRVCRVCCCGCFCRLMLRRLPHITPLSKSTLAPAPTPPHAPYRLPAALSALRYAPYAPTQRASTRRNRYALIHWPTLCLCASLHPCALAQAQAMPCSWALCLASSHPRSLAPLRPCALVGAVVRLYATLTHHS